MATAIVTGASAGIGAIFARRLAERGEDLVLVARRGERLKALASSLTAAHGVSAEVLVADLADAGGLARVADRAAGGDVGMLVNNAAIGGYARFAQADPAVLRQVLALNVTAPLLLTRAALPGMLERGGGALVNVASLLAFAAAMPPDPLPLRATYAGTKGFVVTFTRTLAAEIADSPVQVQVLCPGYTATEFHMTAGKDPVEGPVPLPPPHAMDPEDVVQASFVAREAGEVVCVPGLEDPAAIDALVDAEAGVRAADWGRVASRYARP